MLSESEFPSFLLLKKEELFWIFLMTIKFYPGEGQVHINTLKKRINGEEVK